MAFTAMAISLDWCAHAYVALDGTIAVYDGFIMFFHSLAILWCTLFFYNRTMRAGERLAWLTLLLEWMDLIMIIIAILVLHDELGKAFSLSLTQLECSARKRRRTSHNSKSHAFLFPLLNRLLCGPGDVRWIFCDPLHPFNHMVRPNYAWIRRDGKRRSSPHGNFGQLHRSSLSRLHNYGRRL